jgi:stage 0 sporulation protein B (sporulation initiation phosphotransferase)
MRRGFGMRTAAGVVGVSAWAGQALFSLPLPVRLVLALTAAACVWLWIRSSRMASDARWRERMIRMLGHHRHDWMNELQVLFGYARLKRYDNLPDYMDKIKTTALHDSYLSKLGIPELVVYLLEERIQGGVCSFEVELEKEIDLRRLEMDGRDVYKLISGITELMKRHASPDQGEPGDLSIGFDEDEGELLVDFVYQGAADWKRMELAFKLAVNGRKRGFEVREEEFGEDRAVVALALPFRT